MKKRFFLSILLPGALLCIVLLAISCDSDKLWTSTNEMAPEFQALLVSLMMQKTVQTGPYHIIVDATGFPSTGFSITLRNGFQYLHITTSGTFTFPFGLAANATYNVVITAVSPDGTSCTISGASGIISSADVTVTLGPCMTP